MGRPTGLLAIYFLVPTLFELFRSNVLFNEKVDGKPQNRHHLPPGGL